MYIVSQLWRISIVIVLLKHIEGGIQFYFTDIFILHYFQRICLNFLLCALGFFPISVDGMSTGMGKIPSEATISMFIVYGYRLRHYILKVVNAILCNTSELLCYPKFKVNPSIWNPCNLYLSNLNTCLYRTIKFAQRLFGLFLCNINHFFQSMLIIFIWKFIYPFALKI